MEDAVGKMNINAVTNMMCDHSVFAHGVNIVVYMDSYGASNVTTVFSFNNDRCSNVDMTMIYGDKESMERDVAYLLDRFNWLYNGNAELGHVANYKVSGQEMERCLVWSTPYSLLRMRFIEKPSSESVQISMAFK